MSEKIILSSKEIKRGVKYCANIINEKFCNQNVVVVGIMDGGTYFTVDLTRELDFEHTFKQISCKSYDNQKQGKVTIYSTLDPKDYQDKKIILVDELYDTGNSVAEVKKHIIEQTGNSDIFVCTVFKKNKESLPGLDLYAFLVPNVWLVGYGLDDNGTKRNYKYLCGKPTGSDKEDEKLFESEEVFERVKKRMMEKI